MEGEKINESAKKNARRVTGPKEKVRRRGNDKLEGRGKKMKQKATGEKK